MVTHNIEEAVSMADRILVLGANPGRIRVELPGMPMAQRSFQSEAHTALVDLIYRIMTSPEADVATLLSTRAPQAKTGQLAPTAACLYQFTFLLPVRLSLPDGAGRRFLPFVPSGRARGRIGES